MQSFSPKRLWPYTNNTNLSRNILKIYLIKILVLFSAGKGTFFNEIQKICISHVLETFFVFFLLLYIN